MSGAEGKAPTIYEKVFPDTKEGVIAMLREMLSDVCITRIETASFVRDPHAHGVWAVAYLNELQASGERDAVVYLAGYRTPYGDKRQHNDFELGLMTERELRKNGIKPRTKA